jgi:hypothetical protein
MMDFKYIYLRVVQMKPIQIILGERARAVKKVIMGAEAGIPCCTSSLGCSPNHCATKHGQTCEKVSRNHCATKHGQTCEKVSF